MRRRLLLANSHAASGGGDLPSDGLPPESTTFEFPLYLNITKFEYEYSYEICYYREADEISIAFGEWLIEHLEEGILDRPVNIGDNDIYINGCRVAEVMYEGSTNFVFNFDGNPKFDLVTMYYNEFSGITDEILYGYIYNSI